MTVLRGLHHVTAIAAHAGSTQRFYADLLGLRLIKRTVNFDDATRYHIYYGNATGSPGTVLSFFTGDMPPMSATDSWVSAVRLTIPSSSVGFWVGRLAQHGVAHRVEHRRTPSIALVDPDGLALELVAGAPSPPEPGGTASKDMPVPAHHQVLGLHGVVISARAIGRTSECLTRDLGLTATSGPTGAVRFVLPSPGGEQHVDVVEDSPAASSTTPRRVHHVAFRVADDDSQRACQRDLRARGFDVTEVRDRVYFRSIYFHEPGGQRLEIATDGPGFAVDEPVAELGRRLVLLPALEPDRARLETELQAQLSQPDR